MNAFQRRPYTGPRVTLFAIVSLGLQCFASLALAEATRVDVAEELERLMATHGFTIKSAQLEATRHTSARAEGEALIPRLRTLLEQFDHVIVQRPDGGVERVIILGEKTAVTPPAPDSAPGQDQASGEGEEAAPAAEIVVETQRKGTSHALMLGLEGESGRRVNRSLLLDTGADYVVLPASLLGPLGIHPGALRSQPVQTANGRIDAQLGTLNAIWFGDKKVTGVTTAFIDDARLGGNALLGMSVLARFRVTIDDAQNRIVLTR
jgi:clan AA aspartic protease (TIGR02281 family)